MPFTPYHFGPALVAKAIFPRTISLRAFAATQVAIDSEPLYRMFAGIEPLHGPLHSVPGALLASLVAVLAYAWWARRSGHVLGWKAIADTTVFGALSHVILDMWSHVDVARAYDLLGDNPPPDYEATVWFCICAGLVGAFMLAGRWADGVWRRREGQN